VTESEDWVKEFQRKETQKASCVGEGDEISNSGSQRKKVWHSQINRVSETLVSTVRIGAGTAGQKRNF
jgi:hypothetical protein